MSAPNPIDADPSAGAEILSFVFPGFPIDVYRRTARLVFLEILWSLSPEPAKTEGDEEL